MEIEYETLKQKLFEAARKCAVRGPGYAQRRPVLDQVASDLGGGRFAHAPLDLDMQQAILTCWHDLFREGSLSWGYDLDNPDFPFFHIPDRTGTK
jgi:hypothetical protein